MKRISYLITILVIAGTALVGSWVYFKYFKKSSPNILTFTAINKDINETLKVRGDVVSKKEYMLSFESSGVVKNIAVKEGQLVKANDVLVQLDTKNIELEQKKLNLQLQQAKDNLNNSKSLLAQSQAALSAQESRLAEIRQGTRPEELQIAQTTVDNATAALNAAKDAYASAKDVSSKDIARLQKAKDDAQQALDDARAKADSDIGSLYGGVIDVIADVYSNANSAVNVRINELFNNPDSSSPTLTFSTTDSQARTDSLSQRVLAGDVVKSIKNILDSAPTSQTALDSALDQCDNSLLVIRSFLNALNQAVNSAGSLSFTTLSTYKNDVKLALDDVNTGISSITVRQNAISTQKQTNISLINAATASLNAATKSLELGQSSDQKILSDASSAVTQAENNLKLAQDQYNLKKAGATPDGIRTQEALVRQAEGVVASQESQVQQALTAIDIASAQIAIANDNFEKMVLRAPEDGVVSKVSIEKNEVVAPGQIIVSLFIDGYQVQADLSELDIGKVKTTSGGSKVKILFDSLMGREYGGTVISIDPKEIIKEGDSYYRVNIAVDTQDPLIRPGMKADLIITGVSKSNVVALPEIAIIKDGGKTYVKIPNNGGYKEVEVVTGISDGQDVEILSGVTAGQLVVVGN